MTGGHRLRQDEHLSALQPGARLQTYTIGAILGAGGFGITYKAVEDITNRDVAIKEYLPTAFAVRGRDGATVRPLSESTARDFAWGLERFREEAKLLIGFRHPNIVPVLAYFEANGTGYLVMEFQEGMSLAQALHKTSTLSEAELLQFIVPLLGGVEEVHRNKFLHRDIKPANIFLRGDGTPVLLDFGAARQALGEHSKAFTTLVTEGYAPFEQYAGTGNQGPWSDVYALAAVMFHCLTGKAPVEAPRRAVAKLRGTADPMAHDLAELRNRISSDLAFAIEAAMRVVEHERPQSIAAFREMIVSPVPGPLRLAPAGDAITPPAATLIPDAAMRAAALHPPPWMTARPRRSRRLVYFSAAGLLLAAGAAVAGYVDDQRSWLPAAFRRAGPDTTATIEPENRGAQPSPPANAARAPADTATGTTDEQRRAGEDEKRRAADDEKRRAEEARAGDEQRMKGFAEYQRLQLDHIEAERRQYFESRKVAQPRTDEPSATTESERRDVSPAAPPTLRRQTPSETRFPPDPPGIPGRTAPGWRTPNYDEDY